MFLYNKQKPFPKCNWEILIQILIAYFYHAVCACFTGMLCSRIWQSNDLVTGIHELSRQAKILFRGIYESTVVSDLGMALNF